MKKASLLGLTIAALFAALGWWIAAALTATGALILAGRKK
jgi:hypothetical protein